jgi:hypothetical protein
MRSSSRRAGARLSRRRTPLPPSRFHGGGTREERQTEIIQRPARDQQAHPPTVYTGLLLLWLCVSIVVSSRKRNDTIHAMLRSFLCFSKSSLLLLPFCLFLVADMLLGKSTPYIIPSLDWLCKLQQASCSAASRVVRKR